MTAVSRGDVLFAPFPPPSFTATVPFVVSEEVLLLKRLYELLCKEEVAARLNVYKLRK
jgi:hypothetical protein